MICRFQSTLLIRGATSPRAAHFRASKFQSTLLIRGATRKVFSSTALASLFQSTLLIRGATRARKSLKYIDSISIHAPHTRSDGKNRSCRSSCDISIYAPHTRSDVRQLFRSTSLKHFNPRSSCEERPGRDGDARQIGYISIHAPHARSDVAERIEREKRDISIHAPHARSDVTSV